MARASRGEPWEKAKSPFATTLWLLMNEQPVTTQAQLAEITGKTRQTISQYVNGVSEPGYDTLVKIADHFKVSLDYLLGRSKARTQDNSIQAACDTTGLSEKSIYRLRNFMEPSDDNQGLYYDKYGIYSAYALEMVEEFIDFALDYHKGFGFSFDNYLVFRQQHNEHNDTMAKWAEMDITEREHSSSHVLRAYRDSVMSGMYPLIPADASDFFRKTFCDDFKEYLKVKYPLAQPPKKYPGFFTHEEED